MEVPTCTNKNKTVCSLCALKTDPAYSLKHDECKCWSHVTCLKKTGKPIDYDYCPIALNWVDTSAPILPEVEPTPEDGVDYISTPLQDGLFKKLRRGVTSGEMLHLLCQGPSKWPIDRLIREKGWGLGHMIQRGATIDDFLINGYDWKQLSCYQDLGSKGKDRRIIALQSLKTSADHFRSYSDALPLAEMEFGAPELKKYFGLHFDGMKLCSPASDDWNAEDCVRMGLNMDDLLRLGLQYHEQYGALFTDESDADLFELRKANEAGEMVTVGTYRIPLTWTIRLVEEP